MVPLLATVFNWTTAIIQLIAIVLVIGLLLLLISFLLRTFSRKRKSAGRRP